MFVVTTAIRKLVGLKKRIKVVRGGTSAGKTFGIIPVLINRCIEETGLEISVVAESVPHLRRGALKDFLKIMMDLNLYKNAQFNKSTLKYTFLNDSYIEFFSADQPDRLRGARRTDLYVNECNNIPFDSYYQLAVRTSGDVQYLIDKEGLMIEENACKLVCLMNTHPCNEIYTDGSAVHAIHNNTNTLINNQSINNNYGNKESNIIKVKRSVSRVTRGERPCGNAIESRSREATIRHRPISYTARVIKG